jgi:SAM-dependent methyltransferase
VPEDEADHAVILDPEHGYRRLDPLPVSDKLDGFYQSAYVDLVRRGQRFPEMGHLLGEDSEAATERDWLRATFHADVLDALDANLAAGAPRVLIDIGCGIGEFVASATEASWSAIGLEPSREATDYAIKHGRPVVCSTLEAYIASGGPPSPPDAVLLKDVLEHVLDPTDLLGKVRSLLPVGGLLVIRVPNDFNPLQDMARAALGHRRWWIASPDHVNYFGHASLRRVVEAAGFETVDQWGDFPMELFLLMGDDYIADRGLGAACHARRQRLELRLDPDARRAFGRSLVPLGWGRNSIIVARARPPA